ncbi:MAG: hypothetical protein IPN68_16540 [Bacteroidetes bacterium]|nr:hypothetical protein [Bacteroidota bacterium]
MEFNATIDLIIKDLNDACQIIDDLRNYPGVPELQVELAKAKCKSAGDVIALLKTIKQQPVAQKIEKIQEPVIKEVPVLQAVRPDPIIEIEEPAPVEEKKPVVKSVRVKQPAEEREKKIENKMTPEKIENKPQGQAIIADNFTGKSSSINEQLGTFKGEDDVTEIIKSKPIQNLKAAIGLNDRFLFIREIFNGDNEAYDHALSKLEETRSVADAKAVIISYTGISEENEAVKQLMDLVKRKHILNE